MRGTEIGSESTLGQRYVDFKANWDLDKRKGQSLYGEKEEDNP